MTQFHHLDECGDPGLDLSRGASSHFTLALVQTAERASIPALVKLRRARHLSPYFEFKFHDTAETLKAAFFAALRPVPFRVRVAVVDKARLPESFMAMSGQELYIHFLTELVLRASELEIANDILVTDRATKAFRRALRLCLSERARALNRVRPFKKIARGDADNEDGLQCADMIAGAVARYFIRGDDAFYRPLRSKVVDLWQYPEKRI
jgi:hypothetical protein